MSRAAEREQPHSIDAEQAVLGSILIDPNVLPAVSAIVTPQDFYDRAHGVVYKAMLACLNARIRPDMITIVDKLQRADKRKDWLQAIGGVSYLTKLPLVVPHALDAVNYAEIVRDHAVRRRYIEAGTQIVTLGFDEYAPLTDLMTQSRETLDKAGTVGTTEGYKAMTDVVGATLDAVGTDRGITVRTGFTDLDARIQGMEPGWWIIWAARPAVGKTSAMIQMSYNAAAKDGQPVGIISLEMSNDELVKRWLSTAGQVNTHDLRRTDLDEHELQHIYNTGGKLSNLPIYVDDRCNGTLADVISRSRSLVHGAGVQCLFIDYLQLIYEHAERGGENRVQELTRITRALKLLARELQIPIVTLSQLSRSLETRNDHRPMMSDLRDSGSIEQDADIVVFIHRPDFYDRDATPNVAELILAKNRHGPPGTAEVGWRPQFAQFVNMAKREDSAA